MIMKKIKRTNNVEMETPVVKSTQKSTKDSKSSGEKKTNKKDNKLPPDTYKDEVEPLEMFINEGNKLVFSVKRQGDLGMPHVDIRHFVSNETYTGFTKKGINFPLEFLLEFIMQTQDLNDACDDKGLE